MALQSLAAVAMALVESSWLAASIMAKYLIAVHLGATVYSRSYSVESFAEHVEKYSRMEVWGIFSVGVALMLTGLEPRVLLKPASQLIALGYLGFLFWRY